MRPHILVVLLIPLVMGASYQIEALPNGVTEFTVEGGNKLVLQNQPYDIVGDYTLETGDATILRYNDSVKFRINDALSVENQQYIFSYNLDVDEPSSVRFILPEHFILSNLPAAALPDPDITTDGRRISLFWDIKENATFVVIFERTYGDNSLMNLLQLLIILILGMALIILIASSRRNLRKTLGDNELSIMKVLAKHGSMNQKELVRHSGYSKSRISKLVARLEEKGFVERRTAPTGTEIKIKKRV